MFKDRVAEGAKEMKLFGKISPSEKEILEQLRIIREELEVLADSFILAYKEMLNSPYRLRDVHEMNPPKFYKRKK